VLSEFRDRLRDSHSEARLLDTLLERCRALGWLTARGQQRTDSTHGLAAIRVLTRLELVVATLRAALNELATVAPDWLRGIAPVQWYERFRQQYPQVKREPWQMFLSVPKHRRKSLILSFQKTMSYQLVRSRDT
jgi:transposase